MTITVQASSSQPSNMQQIELIKRREKLLLFFHRCILHNAQVDHHLNLAIIVLSLALNRHKELLTTLLQVNCKYTKYFLSEQITNLAPTMGGFSSYSGRIQLLKWADLAHIMGGLQLQQWADLAHIMGGLQLLQWADLAHIMGGFTPI